MHSIQCMADSTDNNRNGVDRTGEKMWKIRNLSGSQFKTSIFSYVQIYKFYNKVVN